MLCDALPESAERAVLLNGLGLTRYIQGDYEQALAIAERVRQLGERTGAPVLPMCGALLSGMVHAIRGDQVVAARDMETGIAICEKLVPTFRSRSSSWTVGSAAYERFSAAGVPRVQRAGVEAPGARGGAGDQLGPTDRSHADDVGAGFGGCSPRGAGEGRGVRGAADQGG